MNADIVLMPIRQQTLARLVACGFEEGMSLDDLVTRLMAGRSITNSPSSSKAVVEPLRFQEAVRPGTASQRYRATLNGEVVGGHTLKDVLAGVLNCMANADETFLPRLAAVQGRTRRHVARSREAIHPGRDDLNRRFTMEFRLGWWIGTNYSAVDVRRILKVACGVADLTFGEDLDLDF